MINLPPPIGYKPSKKSKGVFRSPTQEERKLIAKFILANGSYKAEIEFNISKTLAKSIRNQFGIAPLKVGRSATYTDEDVKKWIAYLKANKNNIKQCSKNFSCSHDTVARRVKEYESKFN